MYLDAKCWLADSKFRAIGTGGPGGVGVGAVGLDGDDHTPILADRLSLFQSEGKIEPARLLLAQTSDFQNFLRPFLN